MKKNIEELASELPSEAGWKISAVSRKKSLLFRKSRTVGWV